MSESIRTLELCELPVPNYKYITREDDAREVLNTLANYPVLEVDTEGTSLDPFTCKTTLIQIGVPNMAYIFDIRSDLPDINIHGSLFKDILTNKTQLKLLQNANYDLKVLKTQFGYYIENIYDTMITEQLLYLGVQSSGFSLARLAEKYLSIHMPKEVRSSFMIYDQEFTEKQLVYAANDVCLLDLIRNYQRPRIEKYNLQEVLDLEMSFLKPLAEMELNGITLDVDKWRIMMSEFEQDAIKQRESIEKSLQGTQDQMSLFGLSTINIDSPKQLLDALNKIGIKLDSTSVEALSKFKGHPTIDALLSYRKNAKLVNTYGEALIERIHPKTGRLHTQFKQMVSTGRMSSNNPNLQNIPGKQKFRSCFIASKGKRLITVDQNSAELVILGELSKEPNFLKAYDEKLDLHTLNASRVFKVPYDEVTKEQRKASKAISFGLCLADDTIIITDRGLINIKDVNIGDIVCHDIGSSSVEVKKCTGKKECFRITTKYGYSIDVTEDHLVKVINSNGKYIDKKVKDLDIKKDQLCLRSGGNLFPEKLYEFELSIYKALDGKIKKPIELPKVLDEWFAKFLGTFVSEGSFSKSTNNKFNALTFGFSNKIEEYLLILEEIFSKFFSNVNRLNYNNLSCYNLCSTKFAKFIKDICGVSYKDNKTTSIRIPECIKQSPKHIQVAFLQALYEGDGSIWKKLHRTQIEYSSMSINLIRDLQVMLLNFGIISSIIKSFDKRYPERSYYKLIIIGEDSRKLFMEEIGFLTSHKNSKFLVHNGREYPSYSINNQVYLLKELKRFIRGLTYGEVYHKLSNVDYKYKKCYRIKHRINSWINSSLDNSDELNKITSKQLPILSAFDSSGFLDFIYKNNIVALPIKSISSVGVKKVYDLTIADHPYFLANGVIVHNCYGISAIGLSKRLGITSNEAQELIDNYFKVNKYLKKFLTNSARTAVKYHSSTTVTGRRRFYNIPPVSDPTRKMVVGSVERAAKNHTIQGCIVSDSVINGLGLIGKYVGKRVNIETGFGNDNARCVYSGRKDVFDLKLSNGSFIGITLEHKIPVVTIDGSIVDKPVKDIKLKGDFLLIPLKPLEGNVSDLSGYSYKNKGNAKLYPYPSKMNHKLAFVIGALIGDGSYIYDNHFKFICPSDQQELADKYCSYIEDLFSYKPKVSFSHKKDENRKNLPVYSVHSVAIRNFLEFLGLRKVIHYKKSIPEYFYTESIENKGALLNGLFSTDGSIDESGPNYTTVSVNLAKGIQNILFSLGINSSLKTYNNVSGRMVYRLQVQKRFNRKFEELIGFSVDKKKNKLKNSSLSNKNPDGSIVPSFIPKMIYKELRKSSTYFSDFTYNEKAHLRRFSLGSCSFTSWRKYYHRLPEGEVKEFLARFLDFDFCSVVDLSYRGIEDTYDLMCDNIHYFTANGVIIHNSDSDTIKKAMILCVERLEKYGDKAKLLLSVHDEIVVECDEDIVEEVAGIVTSSVDDGFNTYFKRMPMKTDAVIGPCWIKSECGNKIDGKECGHNVMKFSEDKHYGSKLVCEKCGFAQE